MKARLLLLLLPCACCTTPNPSPPPPPPTPPRVAPGSFLSVEVPNTKWAPGQLVTVRSLEPFAADIACEPQEAFPGIEATPDRGEDSLSYVRTQAAQAGISASVMALVKADAQLRSLSEVVVEIHDSKMQHVSLFKLAQDPVEGCIKALRRFQVKVRPLLETYSGSVCYTFSYSQGAELSTETLGKLAEIIKVKADAFKKDAGKISACGTNLVYGVVLAPEISESELLHNSAPPCDRVAGTWKSSKDQLRVVITQDRCRAHLETVSGITHIADFDVRPPGSTQLTDEFIISRNENGAICTWKAKLTRVGPQELLLTEWDGSGGGCGYKSAGTTSFTPTP